MAAENRSNEAAELPEGDEKPPEHSRPLNAKQKRFCAELRIDDNARAAAKRAGYSPRTAEYLMKDPRVKAEVARLRWEARRSLQLEAETIDRELLAIATSDIAAIVQWDRETVTPIPSHLLGPHVTRSIKAIRTTKYGVSVELHDKRSALDSLMRRLGMDGAKQGTSDPATLTDDELERIIRDRETPGAGVAVKLAKRLGGKARGG